MLTDQHSYRSANPFSDPSLGELGGDEFTGMSPESLMQILDGGRAFNGGNPPSEVRFNDAHVANPQRSAPPQTILGAEQKAWFKERLKSSTAAWKIWGNSQGALDERADPQNLPASLTKEPWPKNDYANMGSGNDWGTAYAERAEIYHLVRDAKITGFAIVSGDRHTFWAGYATAELPPGKFDPVGLSFVGASLVSPNTMEANEHSLPKDAPLRSLFLVDREAGKPDWTFNMLLRHGVRSCLEYAKSFDLKRARSLSNPDLAPHLEFVDLGGHGYAKVQLSPDEMRTEFVCIPRPITRSERPDGGPIRYRVVHTAALWKSGERPKLKATVLEGDVGLSI
jgi:alkaline phosphatase D